MRQIGEGLAAIHLAHPATNPNFLNLCGIKIVVLPAHNVVE